MPDSSMVPEELRGEIYNPSQDGDLFIPPEERPQIEIDIELDEDGEVSLN